MRIPPKSGHPIPFIPREGGHAMKGCGKKLLGGTVALAVLAGLVAAEAQQPIRIGASLSLTGTYAALGQNQQRGYQLCAKHVNEKGGVLGRKVEVVFYDDQSQPATGVRLYEKLIPSDKVDAIMGP